MSAGTIDLTGGTVRVVGNAGDEHQFRLTNETGQTLITEGGSYELEFESAYGTLMLGGLDLTQLSSGVIVVPITIKNGSYRVRRLDPRRTILTLEVEAQ